MKLVITMSRRFGTGASIISYEMVRQYCTDNCDHRSRQLAFGRNIPL